MATKRLKKEERRQQLLDVARAIIRDEGTEMLTLGYLAEKAGVTKPITYDHFGDRKGLLITLYESFNEQQIANFQRALSSATTSLEQAVRLYSTAYVNCVISTGTEITQIIAALSGSEALMDCLDKGRKACADSLIEALQPYINLQSPLGVSVIATQLGAADAISALASRGTISAEDAIRILTGTMLGSLKAYQEI
ncbi:TetR/AcrR family transcriptional regulator [Lelliottia sp. V89_10]|uniref:TetR/AcrR family transcriptional regulator n=1 Tax=Lelliottia wanjuensis TaxID=3050585 RepID=UPI00249DE426|nr:MULTISPECIES: TetR/AcrR family transcriptional regulator [unclassified Lelliottia]MDI3359610.1 TetR/AcrR family transcriptional regulator [Lelliottia sp. V89_13]MDK9548568.1 TetR/AcrR family transcriptional regulator [Lelliottia sp. V89_5]MDK9595168.1 TetR/AcrR family transcriptional regulator [Lelliottia sp. V89_10]